MPDGPSRLWLPARESSSSAMRTLEVMALSDLIRNHRRAVGGIIAVGLALAIFVIIWFEPQQLFLNRTVDEALPIEADASATSSAGADAPTTLASGSFRSLEHETTGTASLVKVGNAVVLRFEDLDTSNGPDLRVYLSRKPATLGWRNYGDDFIELGPLKGNEGDQNYRVPSNVDLKSFKSAVVWCVRFKVGFGVAPLDA